MSCLCEGERKVHHDRTLLNPGFLAEFDAASYTMTLFNMFILDFGYFILCYVVLFHCAGNPTDANKSKCARS